MVLIIDRVVIESSAGPDNHGLSLPALVARLENEGLDHRAALKKAARELGLSRAEAYRLLVAARGN
jgi:hypothetical protein